MVSFLDSRWNTSNS